jgi:hypothetical protein
MSDLRLLEDGGERGGALGPDLVVPETADEGRSGDGERVASMSTGADKKRTLGEDWGGGDALELLEHAVLLDAARDDDGGGNAEPLAREVDLLSRLRTLELVDLKRVTVDTAKERGAC